MTVKYFKNSKRQTLLKISSSGFASLRKSNLKCAIKFKCRYYAVSTMFGAIFRIMSSSSDLQMMKMLLYILNKTQIANDLDLENRIIDEIMQNHKSL